MNWLDEKGGLSFFVIMLNKSVVFTSLAHAAASHGYGNVAQIQPVKDAAHRVTSYRIQMQS